MKLLPGYHPSSVIINTIRSYASYASMNNGEEYVIDKEAFDYDIQTWHGQQMI